MRRVGSGVVILLLAACDDMAVQSKQHAYSPGVGPATPPANIVAFDAQPVAPPAFSAALLGRGQQRYQIYCAPCHAPSGNGDGMIVQRGFPAPESLHSDRLRAVSTAHLYAVISNGQGAMYSFAARIDSGDRWAIAAYVRALQLSQHMPAEQLSEAQRLALP